MFLGKLKRSEAIRFLLTLDAAPTGTPTVRVYSGGSAETAELTMVQGADTLEWYYDYTTGASATVGNYEVKYAAVISGVTMYGYDAYKQIINSTDDIKTETALILTDTNSIQVDTTSIETKVDTVDTIVDAVKARTDIIATAAEDNTAHGSGAWTSSGAGTGAYVAVINVKDQYAVAVANAYVTIHNASNDDSPIVASDTTDTSGNVTLNIDGNVYVRVSKAGFNFTATAKNITSSATYSVTGTALTIEAPADPELCTLYIYPITLDNQDVTSLVIEISSTERLTKVNGEYIKNTKSSFTYDATTTPDSYYFNALQTADVHIFCNLLGLDHNITVPSETTKDINLLI